MGWLLGRPAFGGDYTSERRQCLESRVSTAHFRAPSRASISERSSGLRHLGRNATAEIEPEYAGDLQWYENYASRHAEDGAEGRLVGMYRFTTDWDSWEVHPHGSEVVLCVAGSMTLHQEKPDGSRATVTLTPGQYAINEPGTWHTADAEKEATAVAGMGTEHRRR